MQRIKLAPDLKSSGVLSRSVFILVLTLILVSLLAGCGPAATTQGPTTSAAAATTQAPGTSAPAITTAPPTTAAAAKPQGEVKVALQMFGNENWLPWMDPSMPNLHDIVYDLLIYWDNKNHKFLPGLAESWENAPDGMTLTYHFRKGVEFSDGWGEMTSEDVKWNFEMQASKFSIGKVSQTRRITSMDTPDPYTLVVHFKDPYPTFFVDLSLANSGVCQGILCKKYYETVGEDVASQKPIGTGPYKMIESKTGDYMKFEAKDTHWRVVPEFKTLTARLIVEPSTLTAALKTKEVDLSQVTPDSMADLKASGLAVEVSTLGGNLILAGLGGMVVPADKRYNADIHNKDPWFNPKVRKAMAMSLDRQAMCKAIYYGYAEPIGAPIYTADSGKYQYTYDPNAAKQLLKDAGYPDGFSFRVLSYVFQGQPEIPRVVEAMAGYWQQIGLKPQLTSIDYATYNNKNRVPLKTQGDIALFGLSVVADELSRAEMSMMPNGPSVGFEDQGSYDVYTNNPHATIEDRNVVVDKLNQYYYDNVGPIPLFRIGYCYAWNSDKVAPWPHSESPQPLYLEYVRHAQPLNTYRLLSPWPDR